MSGPKRRPSIIIHPIRERGDDRLGVADAEALAAPSRVMERFGPNSWRECDSHLAADIAPDAAEIARLLRACADGSGFLPPPRVLQYIADLIDPAMKRRRGPKKTLDKEIERRTKKYYLARIVEAKTRQLKNEKGGTSRNYKTLALEWVAEQNNMTFEQLDKLLHPRRPAARARKTTP